MYFAIAGRRIVGSVHRIESVFALMIGDSGIEIMRFFNLGFCLIELTHLLK
jgi:hypothetical protein